MRSEQPWRTNRSCVLRSRPISAEAKLWGQLRNRQLGGHKFVRQMPIASYFADFVCREHKVIVEVDGGTHSTDQPQGQPVHAEPWIMRMPGEQPWKTNRSRALRSPPMSVEEILRGELRDRRFGIEAPR